MAMTFGLHAIQQDASIDELRKLWRWADRSGFDWVSACDHFEEAPPRDRSCSASRSASSRRSTGTRSRRGPSR